MAVVARLNEDVFLFFFFFDGVTGCCSVFCCIFLIFAHGHDGTAELHPRDQSGGDAMEPKWSQSKNRRSTKGAETGGSISKKKKGEEDTSTEG